MSESTKTRAFYIDLQYNSPREPDRFQWADSREGPFGSAADAIRFAESECGVPWRVVEDNYEDNGIEYDSGNEDRPPAAIRRAWHQHTRIVRLAVDHRVQFVP